MKHIERDEGKGDKVKKSEKISGSGGNETVECESKRVDANRNESNLPEMEKTMSNLVFSVTKIE